MTIRNDARSIRTNLETLRNTNQISTRLLLQQKSLVRTICHRNSTMIADAEAHHTQKMKALAKSKPGDPVFDQIDNRWWKLKHKFVSREILLSQRLGCIDVLLELASAIEDLEKIWETMQDQNPSENSLLILENRVNSATERVSKLSPNWDELSKINAKSIVGRLYAKFLGLNWSIVSALYSYKKYFAATEGFHSLSRKVGDDLVTIKVRFL